MPAGNMNRSGGDNGTRTRRCAVDGAARFGFSITYKTGGDCQTLRKSFELAQDTRAMGWIGLNSKLTKTPIKRPFSAFSHIAQCRQTSEIRVIPPRTPTVRWRVPPLRFPMRSHSGKFGYTISPKVPIKRELVVSLYSHGTAKRLFASSPRTPQRSTPSRKGSRVG